MEESQEYIINIPICQHIISKEYINNSLNYFPIFSIEAKLTNSILFRALFFNSTEMSSMPALS